MVNKRGYFFVVDAIVAATIVLLGLFLIFSSGSRSFGQEQPLKTLEDFTTLMNARSLGESTNSYYVDTLLPAGVVPFPDMTPMEEIGYLMYRYNQTDDITYKYYAANFSESLLNESIESRYGASVSVNGTPVYSRTSSATSFSIARTAVLYVRVNESSVQGPMLSEVRLWY